VALARAVVMEPEVLLLDEPMAALDLKLRKEMQVEVKNLQERLQTTFVFVTHDQDEALVMSDRIAVMNKGRVEQLDAPEALFEKPRTRFVADFLAVKNLVEATVVAASGGIVELRTRGGLAVRTADDGGYLPGADVLVGVRPERFVLGAPEAPAAPNLFAGTIADEIYLGDWTEWRVAVGDHVLSVAEGASGARHRSRGDRVTVRLPEEAVLRLLDPKPGDPAA
jgi:spermidine/putrescine transport system ATP-binding protein